MRANLRRGFPRLREADAAIFPVFLKIRQMRYKSYDYGQYLDYDGKAVLEEKFYGTTDCGNASESS